MKPPSRVDLAVTLGLLMGPAGASPLPAAPEPHTPPARNQVLDDQARERPLMTALRLTGESLGEARWSRRTTQEMGSSALGDMFGRYYEKERIQKVSGQFREGYVMVFNNLPEVLILSAIQMESGATARDLVVLNDDLLKVQIQATREREDSSVEILSEGDVEIEGIEDGLEKVYVLKVGDLPPSSYRVLFGRTGPFSLSVIFMQSKVDQDGARTLLKMLGERVRKAVARKPPDSGETVPKETPAGQPSV